MGHIHCQQNFFTLGKSCSFITVYYRTVAAHVTTHDVCVCDSKHQIVLQFSTRHANVQQLHRNVFQDLFAARCQCKVWRRFTVIIISGLFKCILMWHALEIPCVFVELQCVQCMSLCEVFHFVVVTSLLATLWKETQSWTHSVPVPSLCSSAFSIVWYGNKCYFMRSIANDIPCFTEKLCIPIQACYILRYKVRASCLYKLAFHPDVIWRREGGMQRQIIDRHGNHIVYMGHVPHAHWANIFKMHHFSLGGWYVT